MNPTPNSNVPASPALKSKSVTKKSLLIILTIVIILFCCCSGVIGIGLILKNYQKNHDPLNNLGPDYLFNFGTITPTEIVTPTINNSNITPTTLPTAQFSDKLLNWSKVDQAPISSLHQQTVYFGKYQGQYVLFFKNSDASRNFIEEVAYMHEPNQTIPDDANYTADFNLLSEKHVLYQAATKQEIYFTGFYYDATSQRAYFGLALGKAGTYDYPDTTTIFEFNLATDASAPLYSRPLDGTTAVTGINNKQIPLGKYKGGLFVDTLYAGNYLDIRLTSCYGCDEIGPGKTILLNTFTNQDISLPEAGDFQFNAKQNTITYRELQSVAITCTPDQGMCPHEYKAIGPSGTVALP
ncbi:MAG: hypothetical protein WCJ58_00305 [bacterium]